MSSGLAKLQTIAHCPAAPAKAVNRTNYLVLRSSGTILAEEVYKIDQFLKPLIGTVFFLKVRTRPWVAV
jgi:hypothetical protein